MSITKNNFELSSSMDGVAALEQRQQPATSTADWAIAPLPSGLSSAGSLAWQTETPTSQTSPSRDSPTLSKTAILDAVKKDP
ncbi:hypothetical protein RB195_023202 [Necator americanus]|uniref:Uncharacterized protein n=1 Tax=Necator americanus TaxID=51031 RepID=A0ABR1EI85_NECAM